MVFEFEKSDILPEGFCPVIGVIPKAGRKALKDEVSKNVPSEPGIYVLVDSQGLIFYVGKAKSLRNRLLVYCRKKTGKEKRLLKATSQLYWQTCPTEFHAILREMEAINLYLPRSNVLGVGKRIKPCYLLVTSGEAPRLKVSYSESRNCLVCLGPFFKNDYIRKAIEILQDVFLLRDCPDRPNWSFLTNLQLVSNNKQFDCIRYDLGKCAGPCAYGSTKEIYLENVNRLVDFLVNKNFSCIKDLKKKMVLASSSMKYEKAGSIQKQIEELRGFGRFLKKQPLKVPDMVVVQPYGQKEVVASWIIGGRLNKSKIIPKSLSTHLSGEKESLNLVQNPTKRMYHRYERALISKWIGRNKGNAQYQFVLL